MAVSRSVYDFGIITRQEDQGSHTVSVDLKDRSSIVKMVSPPSTGNYVATVRDPP